MPRTNRPRIAYQPALDGVRALSVLAVLAFHGQVFGLTGGYLGVSVFFTLSGYLITSLLLVEHDATGSIGIAGFYVRRARRLLPASLVCLAGIAIVSATTDWFDAVTTLRRDVLGSLAQVANWVFLAGDRSYQQLFNDAAGQPSPLEHYWSLAIEEQFYWVWPLAFTALTALVVGRRPRVAVVTAVTALAAVAAPLIAWRWGPDAAYWATPARACEILAGVLAAFVLHEWQLGRRWSALAPLGIVALAVACITFPAAGGPAYHGALPLVAAASAALIIGLQVPGRAVSALSARPLVWLGRISYGVYLYHWPVFVVLDERRTPFDGYALFALRLAVTLAIAEVSFVLVERPIRTGAQWRPRFVAAGGLAACALVAVVVVALVPAGRGDYWRRADAASIEPPPGSDLAPLLPVSTEPASTAPVSTAPVTTAPATTAPDVAITTVAPTPSTSTSTTIGTLPALARPVRILVAGDSTAEATGAGLVEWSTERPDLAQVGISAEPGCGFIRGGEIMVLEWQRVEPRCDQWLDDELPATVGDLRPDVVMLMTTSWDVIDHRWDGGEALTPLDAEFRGRIVADVADVSRRLLDAGASRVVWVREPVPNVYWWGSGQPQEDPIRHEVVYDAMDAAAATDPGRVVVVDVVSWLQPRGLLDDHDARPDGVHWSPAASARIARDFLGEQLVRAAISTPGGQGA